MLSVEIKKTLETLTLDVKFEVSGGTVTALFGKSGAGKTTTVNSIAGLIKPDHGQITLNNNVLFNHNLGTNGNFCLSKMQQPKMQQPKMQQSEMCCL